MKKETRRFIIEGINVHGKLIKKMVVVTTPPWDGDMVEGVMVTKVKPVREIVTTARLPY